MKIASWEYFKQPAMDKEQNTKLTIDLRRDCDFKQTHLPFRFRVFVIGYYLVLGTMIVAGIYNMANIAIAKKRIEAIKAEEVHSMSQMRGLQELTDKIELQLQKANKLIEWQFDNISGQKILHTLFSEFSKEVLLERLFFKRDHRNQQVTLSMDLKGGHREVHDEFEKILPNLEFIGLRLITLNQSETPRGMHLTCSCQMNSLQNKK